MVFPTLRQARISSKLSYPLGAEAISAEFATVPQAQGLDIDFWNSQNYFLKDRDNPYAIFSVSYTGTHDYDPGWHVRVGPVPRALKHTISVSLRNEFFPQIRDWLKKYATLNARHGTHLIEVMFDEKSETMLSLEDRHTPGEALAN